MPTSWSIVWTSRVILSTSVSQKRSKLWFIMGRVICYVDQDWWIIWESSAFLDRRFRRHINCYKSWISVGVNSDSCEILWGLLTLLGKSLQRSYLELTKDIPVSWYLNEPAILDMGLANDLQCCTVMSSHIGWAHSQNDPCSVCVDAVELLFSEILIKSPSELNVKVTAAVNLTINTVSGLKVCQMFLIARCAK